MASPTPTNVRNDLSLALAALASNAEDAPQLCAHVLRAHGARLAALLNPPTVVEFAGEVVQADENTVVIQGSDRDLRPARAALRAGLQTFTARQWTP